MKFHTKFVATEQRFYISSQITSLFKSIWKSVLNRLGITCNASLATIMDIDVWMDVKYDDLFLFFSLKSVWYLLDAWVSPIVFILQLPNTGESLEVFGIYLLPGYLP